MKNFFERYFLKIKDKAILAAWITGLIILASLLWILTQPIQSHYLMRSVNNVFINNNDSRRAASSFQQKTDKADIIGYWYSMHNSADKMFVFAVFQDGVLVPLAAIVSENGTVSEIMPLSAHAIHVFDSLPESIIKMYSSRIESAANNNTEGGRQ